MKRILALKGRKIFQEILSKGKRISSAGVTLLFEHSNRIIMQKPEEAKKTTGRVTKKGTDFNTNEGKSQAIAIGIIIGKKYGTAVERNAAKRRIKEIFRTLYPTIEKGTYIIIRPTTRFKEYSFNEAKNDIASLLQKAGLGKNE